MGSVLLADIYLNHYEITYLLKNINKLSGRIISYTHYADDRFIIFNSTVQQIENKKNYMNGINDNIQFTLETEVNNTLDFLD